MTPATSRTLRSLPLCEASSGQPAVEAGESRLPDAAVPSRRDFLRAAGFALTSMALSGCGCEVFPRAPVQYALPYIHQPPESTPGRAVYYASTCGGCSAGCGMLVKTRDGRPIKLEGNPDHPLSAGGLCALGQATLLGLYDRLRLWHPLRQGQPTTWEQIDADLQKQLADIQRRGGAVRILSGTLLSPTAHWLIRQFLSRFADARHVVYDPLSSSAIRQAHERTHGVRLLPRYHLARAVVLASFDADFLGTWISPVEFTAGYRAARTLEGTPPRCSYHMQFESRLSLSGAKADRRVCLAPGELGWVMTHLAKRLAERAGVPFDTAGIEPLPAPLAGLLEDLARRLWQCRSRSLVLCGSQDIVHQVLCNFLNHLLDNYGNTLDIERPSYQQQGNDADLQHLLGELRAGQVAALFLLDCNPVYDLPDGPELARLLPQVPLVVSCCERLDETSRLARFVCPLPHFLATWSDAEPVAGLVSLVQPTVPLVGDTRPLLESLATWSGQPRSAYELLREFWQSQIYPRSSKCGTFQEFWEQTLHEGFAEVAAEPPPAGDFVLSAVRPILQAQRPAPGTLALVLYPSVALREGRHAYNPWLQELPDPITKVSWDNYALLSPATAARLDVQEEEVVRLEEISGAGNSPVLAVELPVVLQPGQHEQVVAVALGYGSQASARFAQVGPAWLDARPSVGANGLVGVNVAPLLMWEGMTLRYERPQVCVTATRRRQWLATTQRHHTLCVPASLAPPGQEQRPILRELPLAALAPAAAAPPRPAPEDLWPDDHPVTGHRWGMVIDLHACTGCSACVIACQAENNIPVVGKDEVRRQREMHWLRIDRYYSGQGAEATVAFQPMLCHHCGKAPCEVVCPVLATVHSAEGLNQQIYNRCVGTRYCANNCPYKVRRFNWFDYAHEDSLQNLVLNPDVTVRSRGVMEKCTFCVQRIQEAKIEAACRGEPLRDGAIMPACQQSCPAQAIRFGDLNDPRSAVSQQTRDGRYYQVLAELGVQPAVGYLCLVRNRPELVEEAGHD
jgi:Fe-S-cluster-containing dehydrogenase component